MASKPPLIARVGEALWGDRWQSQMAAANGLSVRSIARYAAGTRSPTPDLIGRLAVMLQHRRDELDDLAREIRAS